MNHDQTAPPGSILFLLLATLEQKGLPELSPPADVIITISCALADIFLVYIYTLCMGM